MQITVKLSPDKKIGLIVEETHTIASIKELINQSQGLALEHQLLSYNGNQLDPTKTLSYYKIQSNAILTLVAKAILILKTMLNEEIFVYINNLEITGKELKMEIRKQVKTLPPQSESLLFIRAAGVKDDETLSSQGIENNESLNLVIRLKGGSTRLNNLLFN